MSSASAAELFAMSTPTPSQQLLGTFPFAIRTPDGRHARVIGHFTPIEWPPSDAAFEPSTLDRGSSPSPVFVLAEMASPAMLPAMRNRAVDHVEHVEWLDGESSSAPTSKAGWTHSILGMPKLGIPDTATHSGPSRKRSLPRLMRSKSDASLS